MKRAELLDKAKEIILGPRAKEYGPPKANFERIAKMWEPILKQKITAAQVALCMIQLKVTRLIETEDHTDSWVDMAGYAGCGSEVSEKEEKPKSISQWGMHE